MSSMYYCTRKDLASWLDALANNTTLVAPTLAAGVCLYRPVEDSSHIAGLDHEHGQTNRPRPVLSVKEFFFPPTERLFLIEKTSQGAALVETLPEGERVIFGVRPCEARGLKIMDRLFLDTPPVDPYYARRRESTTLIGLACRELYDTCFCTATGGSPDDPRDVDLMITEVKEGYLIESMTSKGQKLIDGWQVLKPVESKNEYGIQLVASSPASYHDRIAPGMSIWPEHFRDEYWDEMAERCIGCRICAYVCPTCRCFDLRDETIPAGNGRQLFERVRCWDSCAGEGYRRIAGGHNPRPEKSTRLRNRFYCKFYYYPLQYGLRETSACTGCGRCIEFCPQGVDITEAFLYLGEG